MLEVQATPFMALPGQSPRQSPAIFMRTCVAGLRISKDGQDLIDSKTGAIVNAFGATRFDVAVHALRGDFDPPKSVDVGMLHWTRVFYVQAIVL